MRYQMSSDFLNNKFILDAFQDELEKQAGIAQILPKLVGWGKGAIDVFKNQGFKEGFNYLEKFKTPVFNTLKGGMTQAAEHPNSGWLQKGVGDSVSALKNLGAGINETNTFSQNTQKLVRNIWTTGQRQLRDAKFKTVDLGANGNPSGFKNKLFGNPKIVNKNGEDFVSGKFGLPDRKILGRTADGKAIIKKRLPGQAGAMLGTPVGIGATMALTGDPKEGAKQTATWTLARPFGEIGIGVELMNSFRKKQQESI